MNSESCPPGWCLPQVSITSQGFFIAIMILPPVTIGLSESKLRIHLFGGEPKAKDALYNLVTKWPGWQRHPHVGGIGTYSGAFTPYSCLLIQKLQSMASVSWKAPEVRVAIEQMAESIHLAERALKDGDQTEISPRCKRPLLRHQTQACKAIRSMGGLSLLADDMGLGKTTTAIQAANGATQILVLCPASVLWNWEREIRACVDDCTVIVMHGGPQHRADQFAELKNAKLGKIFLVLNYDKLQVLSDEQVRILAEFASDQALICDESHYLKNRKSQRSAIVHDLFVNTVKLYGVPPPSVRLLLSGTPIQNTPEDLYSQVQIIRPGTWASYSEFQRRYLTMVPIKVGNKTRWECKGTKNISELNAVMATIQIRRAKEDVLDLPPKIRTFPDLELDEFTHRVYRAMKEWALLQLEDIEETASVLKPAIQNAMTAAIRCEQIAQGFCGGIPEHMMAKFSSELSSRAEKIPGRPGELVFPKAAKMVWILETVNDLLKTGKVPVIFSRFNAPMLWLASKFEGSLVLHGGVPHEQRRQLLQKYDEGACRVLFCQVRIAQGLNFTRSQDEIFVGRDWAPAINHQAEDRCHRIGQKGTVNIQIPVVRDTIEQRLHKRLIQKGMDASEALAFRTVREIREAL